MSRGFDPFVLEILWNRLIAIVDEAAATLVRTSFSTVVRESYDFSCVLTDRHGNSLAQASLSIPSFIGTLPKTVKHIIGHFGLAAMKPGDVFVTRISPGDRLSAGNRSRKWRTVSGSVPMKLGIAALFCASDRP